MTKIEVTLPPPLISQIDTAVGIFRYASNANEALLTFYKDFGVVYLASLSKNQLKLFLRMRKNKQTDIHEPLHPTLLTKLIGETNYNGIIFQMSETVKANNNKMSGILTDFSLVTRVYLGWLCREFDSIMVKFGVSKHFDELYSHSHELIKRTIERKNSGMVI